MKKTISKCLVVFLALLICTLAFAACANSPETDSSQTDSSQTTSSQTDSSQTASTWTLIGNTDEFGDTSDTFVAVRCNIGGTFQNTATTGSLLAGYVFVDSSGMFSVRLLEYESHKATFTTSEAKNIVMKIKIGETVIEPLVGAQAPNSDLVFMEKTLLDHLKNGDKAQFVIYIGSSKYNFTLFSDNFAEVYQQLS